MEIWTERKKIQKFDTTILKKFMISLNDIVDRVFVLTTPPPNNRFGYITNYLDAYHINYELRVAPHISFFKTIPISVDSYAKGNLNQPEQSACSAYASIMYESHYRNYKRIAIIEDDHNFLPEFFSLFDMIWMNVPNNFDMLHLSQDNGLCNGPVKKINDYVNRYWIRYATNFMIFQNNNDNFLKIADKCVASKFPHDCVLVDFTHREEMTGYSSNIPVSCQLSKRCDSEGDSKIFKSLLRPY